ncbi:MAG TPA: peptidyl-prolyl cis-trans isomerase [Nannocystaceae bacterium]|nr:peptidyl-prolyl cis-trans isomerase [Nannocystaceae bacterium]
MLRPSLVVVALLAAASPAHAGPGVPTPRPARTTQRVVLDRVVAVVNDEIVLGSELRRTTDRHPLLREALQQLPPTATDAQVEAAAAEVETKVLDELIHMILVRAEAKRFDIQVSDEDVDRALPNVAGQYGITVEELRKQVEQSDEYESWAEYKDELRDQLLQLQVSRALANWSVSEAQVREHYRKMTKDESAKVQVEQLSFLPKSSEKEERDRVYGQAQAAARRLRDGEKADAIAEQIGQTGDVERVIARGDVAPALENAVFDAQKGAIVGPIASGQGYVVFHVVDHIAAAALDFEAAKDRIRDQLENEAFFKAEQELRAQLRAKAHVDVRL